MIIIGLLAGGIAKFLMPGKDPGGCIVTILLGIGGAMGASVSTGNTAVDDNDLDASCGGVGGNGGVLGREWQPTVERFLRQTPQKFGVCETDVKLSGCVIEIDEITGKAVSIIRVSEPLP